MKTYQNDGYRYWYDTSLKLWALIQVDEEGNQISQEADYSPRRADLIRLAHKFYNVALTFEPLIEP